MNLLWKTSRRGDLWVNEKALVDLIVSKMPESTLCPGVTLLREQDLLEVRVAFASKGSADGTAIKALALSVEELLAPLGLRSGLVVVKAELEESSFCGRLVGNPLCWGVAGGTVTAMILLGLSSTLVSLAMGGLFYAIAWLFLSSRGKDFLRSLLQK